MNKNKKIIALLLFSTLIVLTHCGDNPVGVDKQALPFRNIIDQTSLDSLTLSVKTLTGEVVATVNGTTYLIASRHKDHDGNDLAADYIESKLIGYDLDVVNENFSTTGRNVYAVQVGTRHPDEFYIICAHYDSYPPGIAAPGADDNASGTAAVLEAARILSDYETDFSVIFALWDEEEQGLLGSAYYAREAAREFKTIRGVINLDMIGWDSDNDGTILIDSNDWSTSIALYNALVEINQDYDIGMAPHFTDKIGRSDHVSFWQNGYPAILLIENFGADWNEFYHTTDDRIENFNLTYFHNNARLAIGTLAALVVVE